MNRLDLIPYQEWIGNDHPIIISGPCSAETYEQVLGTASMLASYGVKIFRAGVWKPRTRPNSFEGKGIEALEWLKEVQRQTGLKVIVEVANQYHVEQALKAGIDMLWIGARTTVSPFAVQEIADSLSGVDIPVLIKNPIHPDLQLWSGALERLNRSGIKKLGAIHRGFYSHERSAYRNQPLWHLPIELKTIFPELLLINDPSHISGNTSLIQDVSQKALDLDMNGLMIESHIRPEVALSDKEQQITPSELNILMDSLVIRNSEANSCKKTLEKFRSEIDRIDAEIIRLFSSRMDIVQKIGKHKKENNITILQLERWVEILKSRTAQAVELGVDPEFARKLLQLIHKESIRRQEKVMNKKSSELIKGSSLPSDPSSHDLNP